MRDDKWISRIFIGGPWSGRISQIHESMEMYQAATPEHVFSVPWSGSLVSPSRLLTTIYRLRKWRYTFGIIEAMVDENLDPIEAETKLGEIAKKLTTTIVEEMQKEQAKNANN